MARWIKVSVASVVVAVSAVGLVATAEGAERGVAHAHTRWCC